VNALFDPYKKFRADYRVIPWATFVEPEVTHVRLNELEAKERGVPCEVTRYGLDDLDRAIADSEAHGFVKVLTVPGKDRILGVTIVGEHAADLPVRRLGTPAPGRRRINGRRAVEVALPGCRRRATLARNCRASQPG